MRFLKRLLVFTTLALVVGAGLAYGAYALMPGFWFEWSFDRALMNAGADFETIEVDGTTIEYAQGGDGQAIVFVHGFGGDKRIWTPYVERLVNQYRVVAPDLPGHGGSERPPDQDYDLDAMAAALGDFVDAAELPRFHLVGSSMGGGVALAYAIEHPDRVSSLVLLNPWGVETPEPSDREKQLEAGRNVFFPENLEDVDLLAEYVYGAPLPLDAPIKQHLLDDSTRRGEFNHEVFDEMMAGPRLGDRLDRLDVSTLVVVGGADRIVHPSSLSVFEARAPKVRGEMLPGCAHVFVGPCFDRSFDLLAEFLRP